VLGSVISGQYESAYVLAALGYETPDKRRAITQPRDAHRLGTTKLVYSDFGLAKSSRRRGSKCSSGSVS
jgi:hypothetical protein